MPDPETFIDPNLTRQDLLVLRSLLRDADGQSQTSGAQSDNKGSGACLNSEEDSTETYQNGPLPEDETLIGTLESINDPKHKDFESTVFVTWDLKSLKLHHILNTYLLQPYIALARKLVRVETDVVMLTHLLLYFATSVPSAIYLYHNFTWTHGIVHWLMQSYYVGTYTLMMHQHIHMGGILNKKLWLLDSLFPYITNPLMGHTWNSYYYHHVKHHHVEGNGPDDLSSTIRYQRDCVLDFACYVGRFMLFVWAELPAYFWRKGKKGMAVKAGGWEIANYVTIYMLGRWHWHATLFAFILPLAQLRVGLMVGNWGQHAFVDETDPNSDFRSSITLIDVASNRFCFNDGYHTSHHLNPRRHWREHPVSFLRQKHRYASEHALVFRNIDYIMLTVKLMMKDYEYLAKCLVPMGEEQVGKSLAERAEMLRRKTRAFSDEDIRVKFVKGS